MVAGRDEGGKFKKGEYRGGPGRPKRTDEEKFNSVLLSVVTPERFQVATEKQMQKAERGDLEAYKYLCRLLGLEVEKKEISGSMSLTIDWGDGGSNDQG